MAGQRGPDDGYDSGEGEDAFEKEGPDAVDYDDGFFVDGGDGGHDYAGEGKVSVVGGWG